jgi:hypothetical protein
MGLAMAAAAIFTTFVASASAATVNWKDPLPYAKPAALDVAMPDEASATKYYVDWNAGSDNSGCGTSTTNACATVRGLANRNLPGLRGNTADTAAYVYMKGSGKFFIYNDNFAGTPGKEIVIKAWPGYTYTSTGDTPALGFDSGTNKVHDIIIDGGPNMDITFQSSVSASGPKYALHINANNITVYRTQVYATTGSVNLFAVSDYSSVFSNNQFINNEFYGCNQSSGYQCSAIYVGACTNPGSCGFQNFAIKNNIVRDMGGEGLEINPRVASSGIEISGNAIHNTGKQTCAGNWDCRPGITVDGPSVSGSTSNAVIQNNLIWDTGASCIWDKGGANSAQISDNTCYDFGKGTSHGVCMQGVCGDNHGNATIRNNIIVAPNGTNPFDSSPFTASNNICASGKSCGSAAQMWSANTVASTDANNSAFMTLGANSEAKGTGIAIAGVTVDYTGAARGTPADISAFKSGSQQQQTALAAPTNLRVVP